MNQRKFLTIVVYSFILLFVGRNLTFLPQWHALPKSRDYQTLIKDGIHETIKDKKGNYSIYFEDLTKGTAVGINEEMIVTGASVNKVPIVSTLYLLAWQDKIDLEEQITLQKEDIQNYGTGSLRYEEPGGTYTLKSLARLALNKSDNTAAHILTNRIGEDVIQKTIRSLGLLQTNMAKNQTSVKDMAILFSKIYEGKVANRAHTAELLSFMKDTAIEDRIPAKLPNTVTVYHKTGDAVGYLHDVGILEVEDKLFFLGVMTSDIGSNEAETRDVISQIAAESVAIITDKK